MKKIIETPKAPAAIGPYSQAIIAGNMIITSGQIPINPETGEIIQGDIKKQTRQVMENIKAILEAAGLKMSNVIKSTVYVQNMKDFNSINEVYGEYFEQNPPVRSLVEVARLPKDVAIEIDVIAYIK